MSIKKKKSEILSQQQPLWFTSNFYFTVSLYQEIYYVFVCSLMWRLEYICIWHKYAPSTEPSKMTQFADESAFKQLAVTPWKLIYNSFLGEVLSSW